MAVKQAPTKYEASDGRAFDGEAEAVAHDELITARAEYDKAWLLNKEQSSYERSAT